MDRKFVLTGLGYAIVGMVLGIYMAASKNHIQLVTHAHIMLLGFVVSIIYGVCHKLWLGTPSALLARIQFISHFVGTLAVVIGLFLLYGNIVAANLLEPLLSIGSLLALIGVVLMKVMVIKAPKQ